MGIRPTRRGTIGFLAILISLFCLGVLRRQHPAEGGDVDAAGTTVEASADTQAH